MKRLALLLLVPTVAIAMDFSSFPGKHSCPGINNSMECARALEAALSTSYIKRLSESKLQIALLDGNPVSLEDGDSGDGIVFYTAIETALQDRFVVLHRQFWEGSSYSLLDRSNGRITDLSGYPVFSPDSRWVAVANADLDAGYSPNTLQIYSYSSGLLSIAFDAKPDKWGPEQVSWRSPTQLSYTHATFDCYFEKPDSCQTKVLALQEGTWR